MSFVHLHNHSYYSLLQSPSSPEALVKMAKKQGCPAVALTDTAVTYGVIEFYKSCKKHDIKPIIGIEIYLSPRSMHLKKTRADGRPWTLVLLAETQEGYKNILKLTSIAHMEGMYYKPRIDIEVLEKHKKGLIALSGGFSGEIPHAILENFLEEDIETTLQKYLNIFGEKNFFLQLAHHPQLAGQIELNEKLLQLSKKFKIEVVIAQNTYYTSRDNAQAQDILNCIATNKELDDETRSTMFDEDYSMLEPSELKTIFNNTPSALENTVKIAERCNIHFEFDNYHIPVFKVPKESSAKTALEYFRYECIEGLKKRYKQFEEYLLLIQWKDYKKSTFPIENEKEDKDIMSGPTIAKRFEYEFEIIKKMGFESYFLMVFDYIKWAKNNGINVGPGRGSGAGSIIAYALLITDLEPLQYSLLFERFLNPERVSMPDFDIDFQDNRIHEVLNYVTEKYGENHVARICTFGTLAAKAAIKDVGRAMGVPFKKMNMFSKLIPDRPGTKLLDAWESESVIQDSVNNDPELKKIWDISLQLEGCVRHISVHACGVVITPEPLENYSAIQRPPKDNTSIISQFSGKPLESLGLLKMDFLGLKNLTILDTACRIIKKTQGTQIHLNTIPMDDPKVFEIFQKAETVGVFQFESAGMRRYLKELQPNKFEDLIAMNSLYRPGPMDFIPDFINRKHGKVHIAYPHESLEDILKPTYGIAVYQEQILQIAQSFAGYSLGQADILRRAIGKKIAEEMNQQRAVFLEKAQKLGRKKDNAEYIFDKVIVPFAGYGFNKSHAAAYSLIAYQTAYLKAYYKTEFMAALLSADQSNAERIAIEIEECHMMEIEILPPSVNDSLHYFTVVKNRQIRFGLSAIKNLGNAGIESIIAARGKEEIIFHNLEEFLKRVEVSQINKKNIEALICSGALDELGERQALFNSSNELIEFAKELHMQNNTGQIGLFDNQDNASSVSFSLPVTKKVTLSQKLQWEKEFLGLFVSEHPLANISPYLQKTYYSITNIHANNIGNTEKFFGMIGSIRRLKTKKNDFMAIFILHTSLGKIDVAVFPEIYKKYSEKIQEDFLIVIEGKTDVRYGMGQIIANKIFPQKLEDITKKAKDAHLLDINIKHLEISKPLFIEEEPENKVWNLEIPHNTDKKSLQSLKKILENNPGDDEVTLIFPNKQKLVIPQKIKITKILKGTIRQLLSSVSNKKAHTE